MKKAYYPVSLETSSITTNTVAYQGSCLYQDDDESLTPEKPQRSLETTIDSREKSAFIGTIEDAKKHADWLVDNECIRKGYRIHHNTYKDLFKSCFKLHNETTNVWSHLLGAILFSFLLILMAGSPNTGVMRWFAGNYAIGGNLVIGGSETTDHLLAKLQDTFTDMCHGIDDIQNRWSSFSVNGIIEDMRNLETRFRTDVTAISDNQYDNLSSLKQKFNESYHTMAEKLLQLSADLFGNCTEKLSFKSYKSLIESSLANSIDFLETIADPNLDRWPLQLYLICGVICFACSSIMHLLWVKSPGVCHITHNIDLSGISVMVYGSAMAVIHYGFKCHPTAYQVYSVISTASLIALLMSINIPGVKRLVIRFQVMLYVIQAAIAYACLIHWRWMNYDNIDHYFFYLMIAEMLCYSIGSVVFVMRYPERCMPGVFDLYMSSHTIFHVLVVVAAWCHFLAVLKLSSDSGTGICPLTSN